MALEMIKQAMKRCVTQCLMMSDANPGDASITLKIDARLIYGCN